MRAKKAKPVVIPKNVVRMGRTRRYITEAAVKMLANKTITSPGDNSVKVERIQALKDARKARGRTFFKKFGIAPKDLDAIMEQRKEEGAITKFKMARYHRQMTALVKDRERGDVYNMVRSTHEAEAAAKAEAAAEKKPVHPVLPPIPAEEQNPNQMTSVRELLQEKKPGEKKEVAPTGSRITLPRMVTPEVPSSASSHRDRSRPAPTTTEPIRAATSTETSSSTRLTSSQAPAPEQLSESSSLADKNPADFHTPTPPPASGDSAPVADLDIG